MQAVLTDGLGLFLCCFVLHVIRWRSRPVRNHSAWLAGIFLALPAGALMALLLWLRVHGRLPVIEIESWALSYLLHLSLSIAYMFLYTGFTSFSPTIAILEVVDDAMPRGAKRDELELPWFTKDYLTGLRCEHLISDGFISRTDGVLKLEGRGRTIAAIVLLFRRFLGLPHLAGG